MKPSNSQQSGSSSRDIRPPPIIPTPDTQKLYDKWRRAQEQEERDDLFRRHLLLQPDQLSPTTNTPRSRSSASHASTRYRETNGDASQSRSRSPSPSEPWPKGKSRRNGPLDHVAKAKAALTRKLKACGKCRDRKVTCRDHHDLSLFEEAYNASHTQAERGSRARPPTRHVPATSPPTSSSPAFRERSPHGLRAQNDHADLQGVSAMFPASSPSRPPLRLRITADQDMYQDMYQDILSPPQPTASPSVRRDPAPLFSWSALPVSSYGNESRCAIGRQVDAVPEVWECQWGHHDGGTESLSLSLSSFNGEGAPCRQLCDGLSRLREHYQSTHGVFREEDPPFMWKCRGCEFLDIQEEPPCPQCGESAWERRYYGYMAVAGLFAPPSATSVRASDRSHGFPASMGSAFGSHGHGRGSGRTGLANTCYSPHSGSGASFIWDWNDGGLPEVLFSLFLLLLLTLAGCLGTCPLVSGCAHVAADWALRLFVILDGLHAVSWCIWGGLAMVAAVCHLLLLPPFSLWLRKSTLHAALPAEVSHNLRA